MSDKENKRLFNHYTAVAGGSASTGNSVRKELIVSDSKRHLADLVSKNPNLEEVKEEVKSKVRK